VPSAIRKAVHVQKTYVIEVHELHLGICKFPPTDLIVERLSVSFAVYYPESES
jgi:hypothetical protein